MYSEINDTWWKVSGKSCEYSEADAAPTVGFKGQQRASQPSPQGLGDAQPGRGWGNPSCLPLPASQQFCSEAYELGRGGISRGIPKWPPSPYRVKLSPDPKAGPQIPASLSGPEERGGAQGKRDA